MIVQIYKSVKTFMKNKGFYYFLRYIVIERKKYADIKEK